MDGAVNNDVQGKVVRWNYLPGRGFGFLNVDSFPQTFVMIHKSQLAAGVTPDILAEGSLCRFTVKKNSKGQLKGSNLIVLDEEKESLTSTSEAQKQFEFSYININDMSMIEEKDVSEIREALSFIKGLPSKATGGLKSANPSPDRDETKNVFVDTLDTFATSQFANLVTDLFSNTKKGDTTHAQRVESNYLRAAQYLLHLDSSPPSLSLDVILNVHRFITADLIESAGVLRHNKGARTGKTHFPPPAQVLPLLETFLELFRSYLHSFFMRHSGSAGGKVGSWTDDVVREACTLAGWMGFHFVGIHPFSDGNGRTSRLLINWVLSRCLSAPFSVFLCPTPVLRSQYIAANRYGDYRLLSKYIAQRCAVEWEAYFRQCTEAFKTSASASLLRPSSSSSSSGSGSGSGSDGGGVKQADEVVVNAARVALRSAGCLICLEESPTLSTLCCGQPVHFTCLAAWYARRRGSNAPVDCPHCRADVSESQIASSAPASEASTASTTDGVESDGDWDTYSDDDSRSHTSSRSPSAAHDSSTTTRARAHAPEERPKCQNCENVRAEDCANARCGRCCGRYIGCACARHGTNQPAGGDDDNASTTSTSSDTSSI